MSGARVDARLLLSLELLLRLLLLLLRLELLLLLLSLELLRLLLLSLELLRLLLLRLLGLLALLPGLLSLRLLPLLLLLIDSGALLRCLVLLLLHRRLLGLLLLELLWLLLELLLRLLLRLLELLLRRLELLLRRLLLWCELLALWRDIHWGATRRSRAVATRQQLGRFADVLEDADLVAVFVLAGLVLTNADLDHHWDVVQIFVGLDLQTADRVADSAQLLLSDFLGGHVGVAQVQVDEHLAALVLAVKDVQLASQVGAVASLCRFHFAAFNQRRIPARWNGFHALIGCNLRGVKVQLYRGHK